MIRVFVNKDKIEVKGHSGYDDYGKDIVCSSVSSIVTTTINGIISIDSDAIKYNYKDDCMTIEILKNDLIIQKLIDNMVEMLKELSTNYPKNINVKENV